MIFLSKTDPPAYASDDPVAALEAAAWEAGRLSERPATELDGEHVRAVFDRLRQARARLRALLANP